MKDKEQNQPKKNEPTQTPSENSLPEVPQKSRRDFIKIGIAGVTITGITFFGRLLPKSARAAIHSDGCDPDNSCGAPWSSKNECEDNSCTANNLCVADLNKCGDNHCGNPPPGPGGNAINGNFCEHVNTCSQNNSCYDRSNRCSEVTCSELNECAPGRNIDCSGSYVSCSEDNSCGEKNTP